MYGLVVGYLCAKLITCHYGENTFTANWCRKFIRRIHELGSTVTYVFGDKFGTLGVRCWYFACIYFVFCLSFGSRIHHSSVDYIRKEPASRSVDVFLNNYCSLQMRPGCHYWEDYRGAPFLSHFIASYLNLDVAVTVAFGRCKTLLSLQRLRRNDMT